MINFGLQFGWVHGFLAKVADVTSWLPSDLGADLLQWLSSTTSPSTVDDDSDNAVDANLTGSVCATFDGVAGGDSISMMGHEDAWNVGTSDFYIEVYASSTAGGAFVSKFSAGNNERSFLLTQHKTTGDLIFYTSSTGTDQVSSTVDVLDYPSDYSVIRVEKSGTSVTWYVDGVERTSTGSAVADIHASSAAPLIGNYWWDYPSDTATRYNDFEGTISTVEIGLGTTDTLSYYPLIAGSGLDVFDTVGNVHGIAKVGAGGEATFWGTRQDDRHYMATDGGSHVFVFDQAAAALWGTAVSTGTKELTIMARPRAEQNETLFTSNGKTLIFDHVSGPSFDVIYDASTIGTATLDTWSTITVDVDLVSAFTIAGTTGDFEIGDFSLEDNGSWSAKAFNGTTAYNLDQANSMPDLTDNAVRVRQYPASTSGFVGDFDGLTDKVALSTSPTDSFSVAFSAKVTRDGGYNTAYSRLGVAVTIDTTAGDYRVRFNLGSGVDHIRSDALVFPLNEWKTCAVTWDDDTSTAKIFVEGVDVTGPTTGTLTGPTGTYAGNLGGPGFNGRFGGTLYNVKVWDSALSDADAILESSGSDASVSADSGYLDGTYYDDSTLPDLIGSANGTITGTILAQDGIVSTTSHLAGTNDTPINPPADVHNGGVYKVQQDAGDATLLTNLFWSANGSDYDEKTYHNMLLHASYNNDVWIKYGDGCMVEDIVTTDTLDEDQYDNMAEWKGATSCGNGVLPFDALLDSLSSPLIDSEDSYLTTAEI